MNSYIMMWKNYATFSGRTRRRDFWMAYLFNVIFSFVISFVFGFLAGLTQVPALAFLSYIYLLAVLVPSLAMMARRLHDAGKSAAWIFISFVPLVGGIVLLVFMCMDSQPGANQYGPNPKETVQA